jgi:DNA-binding transcriptional MerR regulator
MSEKTYTSSEVAEICNSKQQTVLKWSQNNNVNFIGEGRRKTYLFTESDIDRFKERPKPGRRWDKEVEV